MSSPLEYLTQRDKRLGKLIRFVGNLEITNKEDYFTFIVCEIVGQMISNKVRKVLITRLFDLCSGEINVQNILKLSVQDLRSIGLSNAKSTYILNFATEVNNGNINLFELDKFTDDEIIKQLTNIKGIGQWTTKMFLLFALNRPNVLPIEDGAFIQGFNWLYQKKNKDVEYIKRKAKRWNPYCSTAALYLYECVNQDLIKHKTINILDELG